jgi:hypothetical protein
VAESGGPGDGRSIENPTETSDMPDELEEAVRSDADHAEPVKGKVPGDAGKSPSSDGLTTEEGVNEGTTTTGSEPG